MRKNADVAAQLVKSLTFEVEATPQDDSIEIKNTENMTPLNVKVRVRKKIDGTSFVRKGVIAVPRRDLPDTPIERLRLASSDHTIMSFNMLMEADLEKKVSKKSKRSFFGICLGVQGDDDIDDFQYLPSASSLEKDSRSESGVDKLKNMTPTDKTNVAETSSIKSRKKDKFFGKCKPGGCLDPPFGEDKYTYQPRPIHYKNPIDDTQELVLQEPTDKIFLKRKTEEVDDFTDRDDQGNKTDKSILSLYQGEANIADEENDPEFIITYPPGLSSSGLLMADEKNKKNIVRRSSGARRSRKSFNEFSAEYFSPPRTPRDSKDSQRDPGKQNKIKDLLPHTQATADSVSPTGFRQTVKNYDSIKDVISESELSQKRTLTTPSQGISKGLLADLGRQPDKNTWESASTPGLTGVGVATTGLVGLGNSLGTKNDIGKSAELGTVSSQGKTLEGIDTNDSLPVNTFLQKVAPNITSSQGTKAWDNATTAGLAGVGVATPGLVGLGIALGKKKDIEKPEDVKNQQHSKLGSSAKDVYSESTGTPGTITLNDVDTNTNRGHSTTRRAMITGSDEIEATNTNIPPQESVSADASLSPIDGTTHEDTERDLVFHGVNLIEGSERRISQLGNTFLNRPIHDDTYKDLVPTGMAPNEGTERGFLHTGRLTNEGVNGDHSSLGMEMVGDSERGFPHMGRPTNERTNRNILLERRTTGSEGTFIPTSRVINETTERDPREITISERSEGRPQMMKRGNYVGSNDILSRGSETSYPHLSSASNHIQEKHGARILNDGSQQKTFSSMQTAMSAGMDRELKSRENTLIGSSGRDIPEMENAENVLAHKESAMINKPERIFSAVETTRVQGDDASQKMDMNKRSNLDFKPSETGKSENNTVTNSSFTKRYAESPNIDSNAYSTLAYTGLTMSGKPERIQTNVKSAKDFIPSETGIHVINDQGLPASMLPEDIPLMSSNFDSTLAYKGLVSDDPQGIYSAIERTMTQRDDISRGVYMNKRIDEGFLALEPKKTEDTITNSDVNRSQPAPQIYGSIPPWENIPVMADCRDKYGRNIEDSERDDFLSNGSFKSSAARSQIENNSGVKRDVSPNSKSECSYQKGGSIMGASSIDDSSTERPVKHDISASSDMNSSSDFISQYRDNKNLVKRSVVGVNMNPLDNVIEQGRKKLSDWENKEIATTLGISSHASKGSLQKDGQRVSKESIFLNLAFQAYQEDNQTAIKTLDSTKDQDQNKVVLVKTLLRSHDKSGISVPIDAKHVMNIAIRSAPISQERKSRIPKPISKFDLGKSDYSNSTMSIKDIGNDPHAALSMVFHQELVPLESIIRSLKEDIDSLAAQQMMLTDRLGTQRIRPVYNRKCGCLKRITSLRTD